MFKLNHYANKAMFLLSALLYLGIYLSLHACNSMHISRIKNDGKAYTNTNSQNWSAAEKANMAARCANFSIAETSTRFPEKICKKPLYSFQYAHIHKKIRKVYANALTDQTIPTGIVKVENIMSKLYEYAYKLCEYVLIVKIALEQPKLIASSNISFRSPLWLKFAFRHVLGIALGRFFIENDQFLFQVLVKN